MTVDTSYFRLVGVCVLVGRSFSAADAALAPNDLPVIVNRSVVTELLRRGDPTGRHIRYASYNDKVNPWLTIAGVVEDFPSPSRLRGRRARDCCTTW